MQDKNPPAFQFYPKDLLSDANVVTMTNEELGAYWRLVCHCWIEGSLPSDDETLAKLSNQNRRWGHIRETVLRLFYLDDENRYCHKRLEVEKRKQLENKEKRKKAAESRWCKSNAHALQVQCSSSSSSSSSSIASPDIERENAPAVAVAIATDTPKPAKPKKEKTEDPLADHPELDALFHEAMGLLHAAHPNVRTPPIGMAGYFQWRGELGALVLRDGYALEDVRACLRWLYLDEEPSADGFSWRANAYSLATLRKKKTGDVSKFDKIFAAFKRARGQPRANTYRAKDAGINDHWDKILDRLDEEDRINGQGNADDSTQAPHGKGGNPGTLAELPY